MALKSIPWSKQCTEWMIVRDSASATKLSFPTTCRTHVVYSEIAAICLCYRADQGSETLAKAIVRGL